MLPDLTNYLFSSFECHQIFTFGYYLRISGNKKETGAVGEAQCEYFSVKSGSKIASVLFFGCHRTIVKNEDS